MVEYNGRYGVLGDLGMHVCHLPFRPAGGRGTCGRSSARSSPSGPTAEAAERLAPPGTTPPCSARPTIRLAAIVPLDAEDVTDRPGPEEQLALEILGTRASARWSRRRGRPLEVLEYSGGEQVWGQVQMGYETPFPP